MECEECKKLERERLSAWKSYNEQLWRSKGKTNNQTRYALQIHQEADFRLRNHVGQNHPEQGNQSRPEDLDIIARELRRKKQ